MVRELVKKIPFAKKVYRSIFPSPSRPDAPFDFQFSRVGWDGETDPKAIARARLLNILGYTKTSGSSYSAAKFPAGYHQIEIDGEVYEGQRTPAERLDQVPFDFTDKTVLDIGCNQGGMIFGLGDAPRWAVGLDYDAHMINAGNMIRTQAPDRDLRFFVFDIDKDPHDLIRDFLPEEKVDIVFLLSVCMWVDRWRELIDLIASITSTVVFESNGTDEQQDEQVAYLKTRFANVEMLSGKSDDDPLQKKRRLYIVRH